MPFNHGVLKWPKLSQVLKLKLPAFVKIFVIFLVKIEPHSTAAALSNPEQAQLTGEYFWECFAY